MILLVILGVTVAAALVAGFLGDLWWAFDLMSNVRPHLVVVGAVLALLLALARRRRWGAVVGSVTALAGLTVAWLWVPTGGATAGYGVTVATFNLLSSNEEYEAVIDWVRSIDADVVFLQEASLPWEEAMTEADLGYRVEVTRDPDLIFGTLVLVRDPDATVTGFGFAIGQPRAVEVDLPMDDGSTLTVLGIHPLSPTDEERSALGAAQIDWALDRLREVGAPVVLAGDFNTGPWSAPFRRLVGAGLVDSQRGFGLQTTFPALAHPWMRIAIDHVLISDGVTVVDREVGPPLGSDHLPVVADLIVG